MSAFSFSCAGWCHGRGHAESGSTSVVRRAICISMTASICITKVLVLGTFLSVILNAMP